MHDVYPWQAWLDLTHLSRKRILTALDAFLALMEPHNKAVIRSIQVLSVISKRDVKSTFIQTSQPFDIDNLLKRPSSPPFRIQLQWLPRKTRWSFPSSGVIPLPGSNILLILKSLRVGDSFCPIEITWMLFLLKYLLFWQFSKTSHQPLNTHQPLNRRICQVFAEDAEVISLNRQIVDRKAETILPCSFILDDHTHIRCWLLRSF